MSKKQKIKYRKERVILTEILPYELPLTFTNKFFYNFIKKKENVEILKGDLEHIKKIKGILSNEKYTIPYTFEIKKNSNSFRSLSIIHPSNQIKVVEFYHRYKDEIIYYGSRGNFSIRKISKIATEENFNDKVHKNSLNKDSTNREKEEKDKEYISRSSFFVYEKFSRLWRFFDDYIFYRAEKKFDKMVHLDISKCFNNVYTHSFVWSILNKDFSKNNIKNMKNSFPGEFDKLMQQMNYNETNGIVIGPEFSRIFSEIILQKIDINIEEKLKQKGILFEKDYRIFRYIDDFHIFYNSDESMKIIKETIEKELLLYNFYLNQSKERKYDKPIITPLTMAKIEINDIISNIININYKKEDNKIKTFEIKFNENDIKKRVKMAIHNNNINFIDVNGFLLSKIEKKINKINKIFIDNIDELWNNDDKIGLYERSIYKILDIVFFFFSIEPRITFTISLDRIITDIKNTIKEITVKTENNNLKNTINKKIFDEIHHILKSYIYKKNKVSARESLSILLTLNGLDSDYVINQEILLELWELSDGNIDYILITTMLFYCIESSNKENDYTEITDKIRRKIMEKFKEGKKEKNIIDTEKILLLFDILALDENNKNIKSFGITKKYKYDILENFWYIKEDEEKNDIIKTIQEKKLYFTNWDNYNHDEELNKKKYKIVY